MNLLLFVRIVSIEIRATASTPATCFAAATESRCDRHNPREHDMWWWTAALLAASMLSASIGFYAGLAWHSSVGVWPDEE